MPTADGKTTEPYMYMTEEKATANQDILKHSLTVLTETQPIALKLYRNATVLTQVKADETQSLPPPDEFFDMTAEEIRREHEDRLMKLDQVRTIVRACRVNSIQMIFSTWRQFEH